GNKGGPQAFHRGTGFQSRFSRDEYGSAPEGGKAFVRAGEDIPAIGRVAIGQPARRESARCRQEAKAHRDLSDPLRALAF
ncbi:hypothetical protein, partial [Mesorhizobium sp. M8A.F.Ca.ET.207.01.1.1]|uniref:hypothetical protein n=1 Tax=Mesorhizobium sp. M8A.F.Ca.ET.207.01.1.1 TaxID=2563968 RepID=UPI001AED44D1